jgi:DNA invertase Pin-like site-specific DNA recombinase
MIKPSKNNKEEKSDRDENIRKLHTQGVSIRDLADRFGLTKHQISKICNSKA